jgi:hypothetical protein
MISAEQALIVQFQGKANGAMSSNGLNESRRQICLGLQRYSGFSTLRIVALRTPIKIRILRQRQTNPLRKESVSLI